MLFMGIVVGNYASRGWLMMCHVTHLEANGEDSCGPLPLPIPTLFISALTYFVHTQISQPNLEFQKLNIVMSIMLKHN